MRYLYITYRKYANSPITAHADVSSMAGSLRVGLRLNLHSNFMYVIKEGSDESVHLHRLDWAFFARKYNKYLIHMRVLTQFNMANC